MGVAKECRARLQCGRLGGGLRVCVRGYVRVCICDRVCARVCICDRGYVNMYVVVYVCVYSWSFVCVCVRGCVLYMYIV